MKNYLNNIGIKSKNAFKNLGYVNLKKRNNVLAVSYTHLTLPTNREV